MTEIEKIMSETKEIAENIKANYTPEKFDFSFILNCLLYNVITSFLWLHYIIICA